MLYDDSLKIWQGHLVLIQMPRSGFGHRNSNIVLGGTVGWFGDGTLLDRLFWYDFGGELNFAFYLNCSAITFGKKRVFANNSAR